MTPVTPKTMQHPGSEVNEIYSVPNNEKNRRITVREQEELDHLLKEMIEELESNPTQRGNLYGTIRRPLNLISSSIATVKSPSQLDSPSSNPAPVMTNVPTPILPTPPSSDSKQPAAGRSISSHNYPIYNSVNNNNNNDSNFQRNTYKTRSFSHSPAPKAKPVILYTANPYMPLASPKSSRSTPVSIEEVYAGGVHHPRPMAVSHVPRSNGAAPTGQVQQQQEYPRSYNNMSTITTTTSGPPTPARNQQQLHHQPVHQQHTFSSPSSPTMMDRGSRGVSRSITLTPTPQSPNVIRGNLMQQQHHQQTMQPSPKQSTVAPARVSSPVSQDHQSMYTPSSLTGVNFKGTTRIIPGAKIGDQDHQNRTGVYASAYGKDKPLTRDERQELDDLINGMMEEIKHFPDYSSVRRSATTSSFHPTQRSHSYTSGNNNRPNGMTGGPVIESVSYHPGSGGAGVAATRAAFERAAMNNTSPDPPPALLTTGFDHSNNNTIKRSPRTESKSPVRHMFPIQQQPQNHPAPPTPKSLTRFTDHPQTAHQSAYSNRSHFVPVSPSHGRSGSSPPLIAPLDSQHGGGVLSQAVEPLPPHLLTRPTHYNPRPDSRPFTYGVTSASPLIQRRRVHSESTAYVCENRPPGNPAAGYTNGHAGHHHDHETYAVPSGPGMMSHHSQNLYDVPADLYSTSQRLNQEIDTISEASYSSSIYDDPSIPWLERQQMKLRAKKDSSDSLMIDQRHKSARMMTELMNKVPAVETGIGSEPTSPTSPRLIMPSFNRSQHQSPVPRSPTFIKSPARELVLRHDTRDEADSHVTSAAAGAATGSQSPTNDHPQLQQPQSRNHPLSKSISLIPKPITSSKPTTHYASGSTRPASGSSSGSLLQRQKSDISYDRQRNGRISSGGRVSDDHAIDHHKVNHANSSSSSSRSKIGKPAVGSASGGGGGSSHEDLRKNVTSPATYATINLQDKHKTSPHHHPHAKAK